MIFWEKTLFKGKSEYNADVRVTESSGTRKLTVNGYIQSRNVRKDGNAGHLLWDSLIPPNISLTEDSRVLLLGLGAGTVAKLVTKKFGNVVIDGVEIDSLVVELGKKYFALDQANLNIFVEDAVGFVKKSRYKYDLICVDIYIGKMVPFEVETKQFFEAVKNLLKKEGVLSINKIFAGEKQQKEFENFIKLIFPEVSFKILRGSTKLDNMIIYAQK